MAIVGQGSQARVGVLWEYFPCNAPVVDKCHRMQFLSIKKTFTQANSKGRRACHPDALYSSQPLPHHLPPLPNTVEEGQSYSLRDAEKKIIHDIWIYCTLLKKKKQFGRFHDGPPHSSYFSVKGKIKILFFFSLAFNSYRVIVWFRLATNPAIDCFPDKVSW